MRYKSKEQIESELLIMREQNKKITERLSDRVSICEYNHLLRKGKQGEAEVDVWSDAFQAALDEHEIVEIPASSLPYYIDCTVTIPSNRRIEAEDGAVICQMEDVQVVMFRNEHTQDGTHQPIGGKEAECESSSFGKRDENITIIGGRWEESYRKRKGYGKSGKYDEDRSFYGVSTCFLFNNMKNLTLQNLTFAHTAAFAVQMGDIENVVAEDIDFCSCYADGLHINGNTQNALIRRLNGQVGDDLVALNMYDWQDSSVNFGPSSMILVEDIVPADDGAYKTLRIEPGIYYYDDGTSVDCSLEDCIIRRVCGIHTFKMYYQTPRYKMAERNPEPGGVGSIDNLYFEDLDIDLSAPADAFPCYLDSDPIRGDFAAFEVGSNIGRLTLENIRLTLYREQYPYSYLLTIGPKSVQKGEYEIFDPYVSATLQELELSDITINGERVTDFAPFIKEIVFDDLYGDGFSSGAGKIVKISC